MSKDATSKTITTIGWIVFIASIIALLRQIVFIAGQVIYYLTYPTDSIPVLHIAYFVVSIIISIWTIILGNKLRKDKLETPKKTEKLFITSIVLTILAIVAEFVMFDDSLPIIPILLIPALVKGIVDVRKIKGAEK